MRRPLLAMCLLAVLLTLINGPDIKGQSPSLDVGIRFQQTVNLYFESGLSVNFSHRNLHPGQLFFGFHYVSSRFGSAWKSNAIPQDNFMLSGAWYFLPTKNLHPFGRVNTGYFKADYGEEMFDVLDQASFTMAPEIGLVYDTPWPAKLSASAGFNLFTGDGTQGPGTLFPLFIQSTISWDLFN